jgi:GNAT superfamily N-acetyltransferase
MRITQWDGEDQHVFDGCFAVERAAHQADDPAGPPRSARELRRFLSGADSDAVTETWLAAGDRDVLGWCRLYLPSRENLNLARLGLVVHPRYRCRGTGTVLLRHAARRAAAWAGPGWRASCCKAAPAPCSRRRPEHGRE